MKQMSLDEFLTLPPGAVFSLWEPCVSNGLHVKGRTIVQDIGDGPFSNDFYYLPLLPEPADMNAQVSDLTPKLPTMLYRWGMYDYDQLFAVYESEDVAAVVAAFGKDPHEVE